MDRLVKEMIRQYSMHTEKLRRVNAMKAGVIARLKSYFERHPKIDVTDPLVVESIREAIMNGMGDLELWTLITSTHPLAEKARKQYSPKFLKDERRRIRQKTNRRLVTFMEEVANRRVMVTGELGEIVTVIQHMGTASSVTEGDTQQFDPPPSSDTGELFNGDFDYNDGVNHDSLVQEGEPPHQSDNDSEGNGGESGDKHSGSEVNRSVSAPIPELGKRQRREPNRFADDVRYNIEHTQPRRTGPPRSVPFDDFNSILNEESIPLADAKVILDMATEMCALLWNNMGHLPDVSMTEEEPPVVPANLPREFDRREWQFEVLRRDLRRVRFLMVLTDITDVPPFPTTYQSALAELNETDVNLWGQDSDSD